MGRGSITYYALRAKVKGLNQRSWSGRKEEGGETVRYLLKKKIMTVEECCWIKPATIGSSLYLNSILAYFHNIELLEAFYFASNNIGPTNIILLHFNPNRTGAKVISLTSSKKVLTLGLDS